MTTSRHKMGWPDALRGLVALCLVVLAVAAASIAYQLKRLDKQVRQVREVRVGMSEEDVRVTLGSNGTVLLGAEQLSEPPYSGYRQSTRDFPDHMIIYFTEGEMLQLHCDERGRIECVFWGRPR